MSLHQQPAIVLPKADSIGAAIAALPSPIDFLPADAAALFAPSNTNDDWSASLGKRVLDVMVAVPAVLLFAPLFLIIAALIVIDSKGPVLFRQQRTGACGHTFEILKFRTMHVLEDGAAIYDGNVDVLLLLQQPERLCQRLVVNIDSCVGLLGAERVAVKVGCRAKAW